MYTERLERSGYVYNEQLQIYVSVIFLFCCLFIFTPLQNTISQIVC